ncbi:hypothetical protein RQ479_02675 [Mesorhizobium sp. ISC25]|uniref:hypothetical protein n=1 Tax=Mesorhizobium sp. ISC25 TaxID=3077335 RepID=UPI0035E3824F
MNEPPYPFRDPKQGIREVYARIVRDFDRKAGAFAGLTYSPPWMLATEDWAERSGHSVEDLCEMISQKRISYFSKEPADPETVRIFEDFRNAAEEWREETGYADLPTRLTPEMRKFTNYKELKAHTWRLWSSMGLDRSSHDYFLRDLSFRGTIEDAFGHEVLVVMKLKLGYGGPIRLDSFLTTQTMSLHPLDWAVSRARRYSMHFDCPGIRNSNGSPAKARQASMPLTASWP